LKPLSGEGSSVTIEVPAKHTTSVHKQADAWFDEHTPFSSGFIVSQAMLVVHFVKMTDERVAKTLPIRITEPARCNLKSFTESERLIGEKYLPKWELLKEI
jgi:hypothetical protein